MIQSSTASQFGSCGGADEMSGLLVRKLNQEETKKKETEKKTKNPRVKRFLITTDKRPFCVFFTAVMTIQANR